MGDARKLDCRETCSLPLGQTILVGMMPNRDRFKLHFGPYRTPRFKFGGVVKDEIRGEVKIIGVSDARIPWPLAHYWAQRSIVVYGSLVRAVRRESVQAVAYWWGISVEKVRLVRRALSVPVHNLGTKRLRTRYAQTPGFRRMARKAWANAGSPERRAMARTGMLGKTHPQNVRRKIGEAQLGRIQSAATRRKISEVLKRNGTWRRWTAEEDAIVKASSNQDAAERTGRTLTAVYHRRKLLSLK
jgi:hypothetical protein